MNTPALLFSILLQEDCDSAWNERDARVVAFSYRGMEVEIQRAGDRLAVRVNQCTPMMLGGLHAPLNRSSARRVVQASLDRLLDD